MANTNSQIKSFVESNLKSAKAWKTPPTREQMRAETTESGGGFIILTCLDPRCVPEQFFGPECHAATIRNAGGRATQEVITSITVLRSLMRDAVAVFVIHHSDCGFTHLTEDGVRKDAKIRTPKAVEEIDATELYGCFSADDFEKTIRIDVETLRSSKVLAGLEIRRLALETETGLVRELQV